MTDFPELNATSHLDPREEIMISADSHVMEPLDLWEKRLPAAFRDHVPNFKEARSKTRSMHLEGEKVDERTKSLRYDRRGGRNPMERPDEMAKDGVVAEILYPSFGARFFHVEDAALQEMCFRIYNDYLIEYCKASPDRLFGIATISTFNIDVAVNELIRCKKEGLQGAIIWQVPPPSLPFTAEHYERFWAAAQDLQMPVSLHVSTGHRSKGFRDKRGVEVYRRSINVKIEEGMHALFDVIFAGVLERFPLLKVVIVENDIGWIPFWLEQSDRYFERHRLVESLPIKMRPSEYFHRQIFATFINDQVGGQLLSWWGIDNCMWSNDYPHVNSTWPHSREVIARNLGHLSSDDRAKLVRLNVARLYQLKIPVN